MRQLSNKEMELVALISEECSTPGDVTARLKNLFAGVLEKMLEGEMDEHLGYEKNSVTGNNLDLPVKWKTADNKPAVSPYKP